MTKVDVVVGEGGECCCDANGGCAGTSHGMVRFITTGREGKRGNGLQVVIFGLTVSSSWGNGHATLWRSLIRAMLRRGHGVTFFEKDVPYYAQARDLEELPDGGRLVLYGEWSEVEGEARRAVDGADLAMWTSYCPDGVVAAELIQASSARIKAFYDLDTPVTMAALDRGERLSYLPEGGLGELDLVLSYTGGKALRELETRLGARRVVPLYGSVDPGRHHRVEAVEDLCSELSYLGTYAADRQAGVERLFLRPAREMPERRFLIGGAQYPAEFPWAENIGFCSHLPPDLHPAFFSSSRATLNVTRKAMASYGYCPSGRLFEAAACGVAVLSDWWEGLDAFFVPDREMLVVRSTEDVVRALSRPDEELRAIGEAARVRALRDHTGESRVKELEAVCGEVRGSAVGDEATRDALSR